MMKYYKNLCQSLAALTSLNLGSENCTATSTVPALSFYNLGEFDTVTDTNLLLLGMNRE